MKKKKLQKFVLDFEAGLWKAVTEVFPEADLQGCAFHFKQSILRNIQV